MANLPCSDKKGWANKADAIKRKKEIAQSHSNQTFIEYQCEICGLFHIKQVRKEKETSA